jgi:hypothetical protein
MPESGEESPRPASVRKGVVVLVFAMGVGSRHHRKRAYRRDHGVQGKGTLAGAAL